MLLFNLYNTLQILQINARLIYIYKQVHIVHVRFTPKSPIKKSAWSCYLDSILL
jgi:hypothetical protein